MKAPKLFHSIMDVGVALFGSNLTDHRTGRRIARAVVIPWRGKIYLLGLRGDDQVIPMFLPQEKMSFWKRKIGFTTHPPPDFPSEPGTGTAP